MVNFTDGDILLIIVGFFLPPLAVLLKRGCTADFLISIGLTLLGHVPGIAYAWYVIYNHRDDASLNRQGRAYIAVPQNRSQSQIQQPAVVAHNQPPPYQAATVGAPAPAVAPAPVK